jgi:hypothetical protein
MAKRGTGTWRSLVVSALKRAASVSTDEAIKVLLFGVVAAVLALAAGFRPLLRSVADQVFFVAQVELPFVVVAIVVAGVVAASIMGSVVWARGQSKRAGRVETEPAVAVPFVEKGRPFIIHEGVRWEDSGRDSSFCTGAAVPRL